MKEIIDEVDKGLIKSELTRDKFLRKTNYGDNELYIVTHHDSPNTLREIGRLREITFRAAGGGTGKDCDLDLFDTMDNPYKQLIVWDPETLSILGGYRFFNCADAIRNEKGDLMVATGRLFNFSDKFIKDYLPYIVELGRSFVIPTHQSTQEGGGKRRYTLDNLWDGLGAIWVNNPKSKYFFGKVTMYPSYNREARDILLYYLQKHFGDREGLLRPYTPLEIDFDSSRMEEIMPSDDHQENFKLVSQKIRALGENVPPLINSYINLSPTLKTFGTVINQHFGDVEETAIMVTVADMYETKTERHVKSFDPKQQGYRF